jgi:hypothetical protein
MRTQEAPPAHGAAATFQPLFEQGHAAGAKAVDMIQGGWVHGLTKTEAEELLDWLEVHRCSNTVLYVDGKKGFAVWCQGPAGLHVSQDPSGKLLLAHL